MTTVLLIRHGAHDRPGPHLVGRDDGVGLSAAGEAEVRGLADSLAAVPVCRLVTSPARRCRETAALLGPTLGRVAEVDAGFDELDFGAWRGRTFAELAADPRHAPAWARFNTARGAAAIPDGETILAVASRVGAALARAAEAADGPVAVVTHADVIRTALCTALGLSYDLMLRLAVDTASVSVVHLGSEPAVGAINWRPTLRP